MVCTKTSAGRGIVEIDYDFVVFDKTIPRPVYDWMVWISVLNPSKEMFEELKLLIQKMDDYALEKHKKRK